MEHTYLKAIKIYKKNFTHYLNLKFSVAGVDDVGWIKYWNNFCLKFISSIFHDFVILCFKNPNCSQLITTATVNLSSTTRRWGCASGAGRSGHQPVICCFRSPYVVARHVVVVGAATDQLCVNYGYNVYVCVGEEADDSVEERRGGTAGHTHSPRHLPEES